MMSKWLLVFILLVQAHFAASYLVPLKEEDEAAIGGMLRWPGHRLTATTDRRGHW